MTTLGPIPEDAIAGMLADLTDLQCVWEGDAAPVLGQTGRAQAWIKLSVTRYAGKGQDEQHTRVNDNNPDAITTEIVGYRKFTVSMRCESMEKRTRPYEVLERVRSGLTTPFAEDVYADAGFAFVRTHPITTFRNPSGARVQFVAVMDVEFGKLGGTTAPKGEDGVTIGTLNGGGVIPGTLTE